MTGQATYQRVVEHLVRPLESHFGVAFDESTIDDYVNDFGDYDEATLTMAMRELRQNQKMIRPKPAHIFEACAKNAPAKANGRAYPWAARDRRIRQLVTEFMARFEVSPNVMQAKSDGWGSALLRYARTCAYVQACLITKALNIPIARCLLEWGETQSLDLLDARKDALMKKCRVQAETGTIAIKVPGDAISFWKEEALKPRRDVSDEKPLPAISAIYPDRTYFEPRRTIEPSPLNQKEVDGAEEDDPFEPRLATNDHGPHLAPSTTNGEAHANASSILSQSIQDSY